MSAAMARVTATCNDCGTTGSLRFLESHDCGHVQDLNDNGGQCEDYPCCGHTDGDGCRPQESHTSAYWADQMRDLSDRGYDPHEIDMIMSAGDDYR